MGSLRTLFALAVVFAHLTLNNGFVFVGGQNAVQLFFIISGFLISYVITERKSYSSLQAFYLSRWLRLWPIYAVVALLTLVPALLFSSTFLATYKSSPPSANIFLIVSNLFVFGQDWIMFSAVKLGHVVFAYDFKSSEPQLWHGLLIPPAWSLGLELTFYVIAPFILPRRKLLYVLLACSLALRAAFFYVGIGQADPWSYRFFPTELAFFIFGALSHQLLLPFYQARLGDRIGAISKSVTFGFAVLCALYFLLPVNQLLGSVLLLSLFIFVVPFAFLFQNTSKLDGQIGELSYPIYIGHLFVLGACHVLAPKFGIRNEMVVAGLSVTGSVLFAIILNRFVGGRVELLRNGLRNRGKGRAVEAISENTVVAAQA